MDSETLKKLEVELYDQFKATRQEFEKLKEDLLEVVEVQPRYYSHPMDHSSVESELNTRIEVNELRFKKLNKILAAIKRIANGTYGICPCCNEEIEIERLKVNPSASRCLGCQREKEKRTKEKSGRIAWIKPRERWNNLFWVS
jgi:DnaK suppressor protein